MRKSWKRLIMIILMMGIFFGVSLMSFAANGDIASGVIDESYGQITWRIDKNGHLTVEGWGDLHSDNINEQESIPQERIPWYQYREEILSAEIDVERMRDASYLFFGCLNMESVNLKKFETTSVTDMYSMFSNCEKMRNIDLSGFCTSNVTNMSDMFIDCKSLENLDVSKFDTKKVTYMTNMFCNCKNLNYIDVRNFDTANVKSMYGMFSQCYKLKEIDFSKFDTSNVTNMGDMFSNCTSLESLILNNFDTKNVHNVARMFYGCKSLKRLDISSFQVSDISNIWGMFEGCKKLEYLDLSGFEIDTPEYWDRIFWGCENLKVVETPKKVSKELKIALTMNTTEAWYQSNGQKISYLPQTDSGSVTIVKVETAGFQDVYKGEWFVSCVQYVANKGLMNGYQRRFTPNETITRAMVVQTLYNMEDKPEVTDYKACEELKDVYQDWYTDAVCWAYNVGITTGYDDTKTFKVDEPVTREQLATFFYRYAELKGYDRSQKGNLNGFKNADKVSFYAEDAVHWAVGSGLIKGIEVYASGLMVGLDLAPQGTATRAQMAAILQRFCEAYKIKEGVMVPGEASYIPIDAYEWNGHYYAIFDNCLTWEVANAYCKSRGGHLATITSAEENEAVYSFIKEKGYTSAYFGLSDSAEEGNWTWLNGETTDYTNWNADEPGGGTDENYAMFFYLYEDGTWNDGAFSDNVYDGGNAYICEWEN